MTSAQVETVFNACIPLAREFFGIDKSWKVIVRSNPTINGAEIDIRNPYREATLEHGLGYESAADAWDVAAHEVAHLALAELMILKVQMALHFDDGKLPVTLEGTFITCMEQMTQRLADIFVSACPCPFVSNVVKLQAL